MLLFLTDLIFRMFSPRFHFTFKTCIMEFHCHVPKNMNFQFHKVVYRQYLGEVGNVIIMAHLFGILYSIFYQNQTSFTDDVTKNFCLFFCWDTVFELSQNVTIKFHKVVWREHFCLLFPGHIV